MMRQILVTQNVVSTVIMVGHVTELFLGARNTDLAVMFLTRVKTIKI